MSEGLLWIWLQKQTNSKEIKQVFSPWHCKKTELLKLKENKNWCRAALLGQQISESGRQFMVCALAGRTTVWKVRRKSLEILKQSSAAQGYGHTAASQPTTTNYRLLVLGLMFCFSINNQLFVKLLQAQKSPDQGFN